MSGLKKLTMLWSVALVLASTLTYAQTGSIAVSDPRPIAKAIEKLEAVYGIPITYEDPVYLHPIQLSDVTSQVRTGQSSASSAKVLVPKTGTASFTYEVPAEAPPGGGRRSPLNARKQALFATMPKALESYAPEGTPGMFSFVEQDGVLHVIPKRYMDKDGSIHAFTPLLDTPITILPGQRNASQLLEEVCQALSKQIGHSVVVGNVPLNLLNQHVTAISGDSMSARTILSRLLLELTPSLSWQVFYDPSLQWYVLNFHSISS